MKRIISVLLAILLTVCMAGCKQDNKKTDTTGAAEATPSQVALPESNADNEATTRAQGGGAVQSSDAARSDSVSGNAAMIENFEVIAQLPELPTGCEVTSLAMVLNFHGIPADKCDIADHYLEKGEVGTVDFRVAFEGDPRDENSFGCYAPVIEKAANKYLSANGSTLTAEDISGAEFEDLLAYIDQGLPLIVWGTVDCATPVNLTTWEVDGKELKWYTPEHCMVLIGYSDDQVTVADPLKGEKVSFDRELFRSSFEAMFSQAIVIR